MAMKLPFNREGDFIVRSPRKVSGEILVPGQPVDKSQFSTRLLRMFYEHHWIEYASPEEQRATRAETLGLSAPPLGKVNLPRAKRSERGSPGKPEAGEREGQSPSPGDNPPQSDKPPSRQRLQALAVGEGEGGKTPLLPKGSQKAKGTDGGPASKSISIPEDWEELSWNERRHLASQFTGEPVKNKEQVASVINKELKRRARHVA